MLTRIKYTKENNTLKASMFNYIAQNVEIELIQLRDYFAVSIKCYEMNKRQVYHTKSLQQAKRLARKIVVEEFGVRLKEEVRNVLCG